MNAYIALIFVVPIIFSLTFIVGLMKKEKKIWISSLISFLVSIMVIVILLIFI